MKCPHCEKELAPNQQDLCAECSVEFTEYLKRWFLIEESIGIALSFSGDF